MLHASCNRARQPLVCHPKLSPHACQVTSPANERGSSPLLPWLQARYAEEHGGAHLPVPTELVLAQHTGLCSK